jgi:hypothetical protein
MVQAEPLQRFIVVSTPKPANEYRLKTGHPAVLHIGNETQELCAPVTLLLQFSLVEENT